MRWRARATTRYSLWLALPITNASMQEQRHAQHGRRQQCSSPRHPSVRWST